MKGKRIRYTANELAWVKQNRTLTRRELHVAFCKQFQRTDVTLDHIKALCTRRGWKTGRDGRIKPGSVSWNKGKKMPFNANSAKTQFRKGGVPPNTKFLGHERITKDGYVEISVKQKNPYTGYERRYVLKHKYLWEKKNGPVPDGMMLKSLDGNRLNTDPSNWSLLPRGVLPFLNGHRGFNYDEIDPKLKPAVLTLAKLRHARGARVRAARAPKQRRAP